MDNDTQNAFANAQDEVMKFDFSDYFVFALMIIVSTLIGVYFGCFGSKQKTVKDYLLGGQTMKILPVGLSLVASSISGITLIGVPAEIYTTNAIYGLMIPTLILTCLFASFFVMPIFFELNITCIYEYLELRFNKSIRRIASILFTISSIVYLPSVIYIPSLSLSQVTGINLHVITTGMTLICIFYTMIGGLKAVVWTDFIQTVITVGAFVAIIVIGTYNVGGLSHVLTLAYNNGKLDVFNMDPNPFQRNTFWTVTIGILISWTSAISCYQWSVQRFLSLPTVRDAQKTLVIFWIGIAFLTGMSVYSGILAYAAYYGCDPIEQKWVSKADQIFPYYVLDKVGYIPALPGLFIAGVFSAALSSLSTCLNTLSGTLYEDFIKRKFKNDDNAHIVMKALVLLIGAISVVMVLFIEKMGKILSASYMISGVLGTPIFSLFMMGMMIPKVNTKGAAFGAFTGMLLVMWVSIGNVTSNINHIPSDVYPINTCLVNSTRLDVSSQQNSTLDGIDEADVFFLYKLSYLVYIPVGSTVAIIVGVIVSYLTGPTDLTTLDPRLISPILRRFLPKKIVEECKRTQEEKLIEQSKGFL